MPTPNFSLPIYGPTDTAELDVLLNGQSNAIDAALTANVTSFVGTEAQRGSFPNALKRDGIRYRATDTKRDWLYEGGTWISADVGMYLITPSSVAGAIVQANGLIVPNNGVTSISVNGVFSSRFRDYIVKFGFNFSASTGLGVRLANSGVSEGSNLYNETGMVVNGSVSGSTGANSSAWSGTPVIGGFQVGEFRFKAPAVTNFPKFFEATATIAPGQASGEVRGWLGSRDSTSFDGFQVTNGGGAGTFNNNSYMKVYGLA